VRHEGILLHIFSAPAGVDPDFSPYYPWIRRAIETVLREPSLPLVNVNFPRHPQGLLWTRVSVRHYDGRIVPTKDPLGRELYWFTVTPMEEPEAGTDRWAVERDWVSLTPLKLDITDEVNLGAVRARQPLDAARVSIAPSRVPRDIAQAVREDEAEAPLEAPAPDDDDDRSRPDEVVTYP
jgi:hypothetical protein